MKPRPLMMLDTYTVGGTGRAALQFLASGGMEQCEPQVAAFWRGPERPWQFRDAVLALGAPFHVLPQRFAFDPLVIGAARKLVAAERITVLESHGYKAHIVCCALRRLTGIPWVAFVHGWTSENLKVEAYNLIDKGMVRFADRIVPVSESLARRLHLSRRLRERTEVIVNAADDIDTTRILPDLRREYGVRDDEILLGLVGRLSPEKGHRYFIEAFRHLAVQAPQVKALIVGAGQEQEAITRLIGKYGLEEKIILAGYQDDLAPFYRAFDIFVLPSLREGMPIAALEAMSFAKPVVASRVGGVPEVVVEGVTGQLVAEKNPAVLAEALLDLIRDEPKRLALGQAGKARIATTFDPRKRVSAITEMHRRLLAAHTTVHRLG